MALQLHGGAPEDSPQSRPAEQQHDHRRDEPGAGLRAHAKGVTLVGALGNNHEDLAKPRTDITSPDYPPSDTRRTTRTIDNANCFDLPVEGPHVIGVSALGPSEHQVRLLQLRHRPAPPVSSRSRRPVAGSATASARRRFRTNGNLILSTYPLNVLQAEGQVDDERQRHEARPRRRCLKECVNGKQHGHAECGYYAVPAGHLDGLAARRRRRRARS